MYETNAYLVLKLALAALSLCSPHGARKRILTIVTYYLQP